MKKHTKNFMLAVVIFLFSANYSFSQLQFFEEGFNPHNLNSNGSVVVGINFQEHMLWRKGEGFEKIGGRVPTPYFGRTSVSDDGEVVGGTLKLGYSSEMAVYNSTQKEWTVVSSEATDTTSQEKSAIGYRISGDGTSFIGVGIHNYSLYKPFIFSSSNVYTTLPYPDECSGARANVVNADGSVVGGCVISSGFREGVYWKDNSCHILRDENNSAVGEVMAVSADGKTLFGYDYGANHDLYKYDVELGSFEVLCSASVDGKAPMLVDVSDDGKVAFAVYYDYTSLENSKSYIYIDKPEGENDIYMNINDFLDSVEIDRKGVNIVNVTAVSGNGQVFTGVDGHNPVEDQSFIVDMSKLFSSVNTLPLSSVELRIYPNPAKEFVKILSKKPVNHFVIYDVKGKYVKTGQDNGRTDIIGISDLPNGIYVIKVVLDNDVVFERFVKN